MGPDGAERLVPWLLTGIAASDAFSPRLPDIVGDLDEVCSCFTDLWLLRQRIASLSSAEPENGQDHVQASAIVVDTIASV